MAEHSLIAQVDLTLSRWICIRTRRPYMRMHIPWVKQVDLSLALTLTRTRTRTVTLTLTLTLTLTRTLTLTLTRTLSRWT